MLICVSRDDRGTSPPTDFRGLGILAYVTAHSRTCFPAISDLLSLLVLIPSFSSEQSTDKERQILLKKQSKAEIIGTPWL